MVINVYLFLRKRSCNTEPYESELLKVWPIFDKVVLEGTIVAVLCSIMDNRGIELLHIPNRAVCKNQLIEVLITDEQKPAENKVINRTAGLAFLEISGGGLVSRDDEVIYNDIKIGTVIGFDNSHIDNHIHVIVHSNTRENGQQLGLKGRKLVQVVFV